MQCTAAESKPDCTPYGRSSITLLCSLMTRVLCDLTRQSYAMFLWQIERSTEVKGRLCQRLLPHLRVMNSKVVCTCSCVFVHDWFKHRKSLLKLMRACYVLIVATKPLNIQPFEIPYFPPLLVYGEGQPQSSEQSIYGLSVCLWVCAQEEIESSNLCCGPQVSPPLWSVEAMCFWYKGIQ